MKTLLVISHTEHYKTDKGQYVGWGPTVTELNYLATIFSRVYHAAPLHNNEPPKSSIFYEGNIQFIPLKPSGGDNLRDKIKILLNAPYNLKQIATAIKKSDIIQFRAPTGIGLYVLPYLAFLNLKPYWVKYAGNWKSNKFPIANKIQKKWLQTIISLKTKVTVNGNWKNEKPNIIPFENPCLTKIDRLEGEKLLNVKNLTDKINYCFVGGLNDNKGIELLIKSFIRIENKTIERLHIVGDGLLKPKLENLATDSKIPITFYGFLPKDKIIDIYKKSHFIVLPSKSEGFPKVIGEAMNYGCVPIISNISCIGQYIQNDYNGFLINPLTSKEIKKQLLKGAKLSNSDFKDYILRNYNLSNKFTFSYFLESIKKEILSIEDVKVIKS